MAPSLIKFSKFDELIYIVEESGLSKDEITVEVKELFPLYDENSDQHNDAALSSFVLEQYAYNRSLGLPLSEVAHATKISATLLQKLHYGERLSLPKLVLLAKAEIFAKADMMAKHLTAMENDKGPNASAKFLEKAFAQEYGPKSELMVNSGFDKGEETPKWEIEIHHVETQTKRVKESL